MIASRVIQYFASLVLIFSGNLEAAQQPIESGKPTNLTAQKPAITINLQDTRLSVSATNAPLAALAKTLATNAQISIQIAHADLGRTEVTAHVERLPVTEALEKVLNKFNFVHYPDEKGKSVYLVTSLKTDDVPTFVATTTETPAAPVATKPANPSKAVAYSVAVRPERTLDEIQSIKPAMVSYDKTQEEIEADFKREREQRVSRAIDVLKNTSSNISLQQQALNELVGMDNPKAINMLAEVMNRSEVQANEASSQYVANLVFQNAVKLHFQNPDANQLIQSLQASSNSVYQQVGAVAMRELQRARGQ